MSVISRYLTFTFCRIFMICFVSLVGLFVVIDAFTNLEELSNIAQAAGGWGRGMADFYGPRVLAFFDKTVGVLLLVSAVFTIAMMQRRRELTAVQAAGLSKSKIARPLFVASVIVIGISVVNREFLLPEFQHDLARSAQNWVQDEAVEMEIIKDHDTGILIRGDSLDNQRKRIVDAVIQLPIYMSDTVSRISARFGYLKPAGKYHPAGIVMHDVTWPEDLSEMPSMMTGDEVVVYSPREYRWLQPGQCFVKTDLTLTQMAFGQADSGFESLEEMIASVRQPSQWYSRGKRISIHSRVLRPILDLTLVLLGLPLIVSQTNKNLFAAAGIAVAVIALLQVSQLACQTLGGLNIIPGAALAAWLPVMIFVPLAVLSMRLLER